VEACRDHNTGLRKLGEHALDRSDRFSCPLDIDNSLPPCPVRTVSQSNSNESLVPHYREVGQKIRTEENFAPPGAPSLGGSPFLTSSPCATRAAPYSGYDQLLRMCTRPDPLWLWRFCSPATVWIHYSNTAVCRAEGREPTIGICSPALSTS